MEEREEWGKIKLWRMWRLTEEKEKGGENVKDAEVNGRKKRKAEKFWDDMEMTRYKETEK